METYEISVAPHCSLGSPKLPTHQPRGCRVCLVPPLPLHFPPSFLYAACRLQGVGFLFWESSSRLLCFSVYHHFLLPYLRLLVRLPLFAQALCSAACIFFCGGVEVPGLSRDRTFCPIQCVLPLFSETEEETPPPPNPHFAEEIARSSIMLLFSSTILRSAGRAGLLGI